MTKVENPRLRGRRLEPVEWRVLLSLSPFWLGWGWRTRWWALLVCDEGIVAFEWPAKKYWTEMLRVGLRAGLAHQPSVIDGDSWPLSQRSEFVDSHSALLFPREELERVDVSRSRLLWSRVRLSELNGDHWVFTAVDPRQIENYARCLATHVGATRSGSWNREPANH